MSGYKMNIGKGGSRTDKSVMGSQGKPTSAPYATRTNNKGETSAPYHYQSRPTGSTPFPGGKSRNPAKPEGSHHQDA